MRKKKVLKIVILGRGRSGKTILSMALALQQEKLNVAKRAAFLRSTPTVDFYKGTYNISTQIGKEDNIVLNVWDTGSTTMLRDDTFWELILKSADVCCVCFDPKEIDATENIQNGLALLKKQNFPANRIILVSTQDPTCAPEPPAATHAAQSIAIQEKLGGCARTDAFNGEGIVDLRRKIITGADSAPTYFPASTKTQPESLSLRSAAVPESSRLAERAKKYFVWESFAKTEAQKQITDAEKLQASLNAYIGYGKCFLQIWCTPGRRRHHRDLLRTFLASHLGTDSAHKNMSQLLSELLNFIPAETPINRKGDLYNLLQAHINGLNTDQTDLQNRLQGLKV